MTSLICKQRSQYTQRQPHLSYLETHRIHGRGKKNTELLSSSGDSSLLTEQGGDNRRTGKGQCCADITAPTDETETMETELIPLMDHSTYSTI